MTIWDKMHACCAEEPRDVRRQRQKLMITATLVAQGIPFFHAGMEFCGTKGDNSNSYNAGDSINQMNWDRMILNYDIVVYTRRMIALRKAYKAFRLTNGSQVEKQVRFTVAEGSCVMYEIDCQDTVRKSGGIMVIFNPSLGDKYFHFDREWTIIADDEGLPVEGKRYEVHLKPCTCMVLSRDSETE
jgi:pullulanase